MSDEENKPNGTIQLDQKAWETLDVLLANPNKTKAAEVLGITRATLYDRISRYRLDEIMAKIPQAALHTLELHSERAAEVLVEGLNDRQEKYNNAERILDRVGLTGKNQVLNVQNNQFVITRGEHANTD